MSSNLTRPANLFLSQAMIGFAAAYFLGPVMIAGVLRALVEGAEPHGQLLGGVQHRADARRARRERAVRDLPDRPHAAPLQRRWLEGMAATDPQVALRVQQLSGAYAQSADRSGAAAHPGPAAAHPAGHPRGQHPRASTTCSGCSRCWRVLALRLSAPGVGCTCGGTRSTRSPTSSAALQKHEGRPVMSEQPPRPTVKPPPRVRAEEPAAERAAGGPRSGGALRSRPPARRATGRRREAGRR